MSDPTLRQILGITTEECERMNQPIVETKADWDKALANSVYGRRLLTNRRRKDVQKRQSQTEREYTTPARRQQ